MMPDIDWHSPVVPMAVFFAMGVGITVRSLVARPSLTASQRWLETHVGGSSPGLVNQLAPLLRGRVRARALGALIGTAVGSATVLAALPVLGPLWYLPVCLGALAGALVAVAVHTVVQIGRAVPPDGVRVASSAPAQTAWFVSRVALVAYVLSGGIQLMTVVVGLATNAERRVADVALVAVDVLVVVSAAVGGARYITWLLGRPLHAGDEYELRTAIAWRRDQIDDVVNVSFSVLVYATMMIGNITASYDQTWVWPLTLASLGLAAFGLCLQSWQMSRYGPVRAVPPIQLPDTYEPAPGTNGWILPRRRGHEA